MRNSDEQWRNGLVAIAKESVEGLDEEFGKGAEGETRTIQRLLKESDYGRKTATVEYQLKKGLSASELLRDAARDLAVGNTYNHSVGEDRHTEAANRLLATGEIYLGRFGTVSVEPFPEGFRSCSVKIYFRPAKAI